MKKNETIFNRDNRMTNKTLSRRDNMLVENKRIYSYYRPVRDGMCENQYLAMSCKGLNMYNSLQAEHNLGCKMTITFFIKKKTEN
jgi:hypothetical protein